MPELPEMPGVPGASPAPSMPSPMAPPTGTPDASPQPASGEIEQAKANVQIALTMLEQTLPMLGAQSEEGRAVLNAISTLSKKFGGKKSKDLAPAEMLQMIAGMPESFKQQLLAGMGGGEGGAGVPPGPHVPANLNP